MLVTTFIMLTAAIVYIGLELHTDIKDNKRIAVQCPKCRGWYGIAQGKYAANMHCEMCRAGAWDIV